MRVIFIDRPSTIVARQINEFAMYHKRSRSVRLNREDFFLINDTAFAGLFVSAALFIALLFFPAYFCCIVRFRRQWFFVGFFFISPVCFYDYV